ncbi:MAG: hypothetical protein IJ881_07970 [Neisseriaceae bacterium]|nr:hypothetical protein [Neisseriaceae bacterium]MBR3425093.1 hypothetical protein [Neisseriaceae bacterium]
MACLFYFSGCLKHLKIPKSSTKSSKITGFLLIKVSGCLKHTQDTQKCVQTIVV